MSELDNVRQELLERGDEMVSFRQLVERFDEVEKYFKGTPWNLKQIYTNFNILIGEKPCGDCVDREEAMKCIKGEFYEDVEAVIYSSCRRIAHLPPVLPKQTDVPDTNVGELDCISREAAICLADELKDDLPDDDRLSDMVMSHNEGVLEYQTKLSLLPSVQPKQDVQFWITI